MSNPTVLEIVKEWLEEHGYDGLFNPDAECGCRLDDLAPCGEGLSPECEAGYLGPCDCEEHDWHICRYPPEPAPVLRGTPLCRRGG